MSNNLLLARSSLGRTPLLVDNNGALSVSDSDVVLAVNNLGTSLSSIDINTDTLEAKMDTINTTLTTQVLDVLPQVNNYGSYGNISNDTTLVIHTSSNVVDVSSYNYGSLFYSDSSIASFDSIRVEVSPDGTNWFKYSDVYPFTESGATTRTASSVDMCLKGITNIRIYNPGTADVLNVIASVVGSI